MKRVIPLLLVVLMALVWLAACEKVADPATDSASELTQPLTSIPTEYGELEAVTVMPEYPGWFQLWFQDSAGTIRQVRIHPGLKVMHTDIQVINRSGQPMPVEEEG